MRRSVIKKCETGSSLKAHPRTTATTTTVTTIHSYASPLFPLFLLVGQLPLPLPSLFSLSAATHLHRRHDGIRVVSSLLRNTLSRCSFFPVQLKFLAKCVANFIVLWRRCPLVEEQTVAGSQVEERISRVREQDSLQSKSNRNK